jgi:hypothetical protein
MHREPWGNELPPWIEANGEINSHLRNVYNTNRPIILERRREGAIQSVYNFPIQNDISTLELMRFARSVFDNQSSAFKINVNFGYILQSRENVSMYRYFKPFNHEGVLQRPILIRNRSDLSRLEFALNRLNLTDHLLTGRDDTKWIPVLLTNVRFSVYKTSFPLGHFKELSEHIKNKQGIIALDTNPKTGSDFDDYLCAFRCLAVHENRKLLGREFVYSKHFKSIEKKTKELFNRWIVMTEPELPFKGLLIPQCIPFFEDVFEINVEIYSLDENGVAHLNHRSLGRFSDTLHLNVHGNHLSYITDFEKYANAYMCKHCKVLYKHKYECARHESTCLQKTKYIYPGGFYKPKETIFDQLK